MKPAYVLLAAAAIFASAACNAEKADNSTGTSAAAIKPVAPPKGGDWTKVVSKTADGGYVMGNPNADVKLVEFGSMTCPHCAQFEETGNPALVDKYVKSGRVSFEFRNFVRDPFDLTASLIARCGGEQRFFPLTHALFADQRNWTAKLQTVPQEQLQALTNLPPEQQFVQIAQLSGLQTWAAQHGVPSARSSACLANSAEINKLVQMNTDATTQYPEFSGTPSFVINGKMLEQTATWEKLEPQLRDAVGS